MPNSNHPALFKTKYGYHCDVESRLAVVKKSDWIGGLKEALDHDLQKTVRTAIERRIKKLESDLEASAPQSSPTPPVGMYRPKEDSESTPPRPTPSAPRPAEKALQTIGKGISDEQIAEALGRADQLAQDYLTQCLLAGATLCAAKAATKHGEWGARMEKIMKNRARSVFGARSVDSAQIYMKLWRAFLADLDSGQVIPFADQGEADEFQEALIALPTQVSGLSSQPSITRAITVWIGQEGSIRGLLDRLGRAEREADLEEDEANKDHSKPANAPPPSVQTNFEATLFDERQGLLTRLRQTLNSDVYTTLPKSEWQRAFGEIEPLYQLLRQRAGF